MFKPVILTIFPEVLRSMGGRVSDLRMTIYALLLIVLMLSRPTGIFGSHELKMFSKKKGVN